MHYRNLRHLLTAGASRLVLSIDGDDNAGGGAGDLPAAPPPDEAPPAEAPPADAPPADPAPAAAPSGEEGDEPAAPKPARVPWQQKRLDKLTAEARAAQEEAERLRREKAEADARLAAYQATYGDAPAPGLAPAAAPPAAPAGGRTYTAEEFQAAVAHQSKLATIDNTLNRWFDEGVAEKGDAFRAQMAQVGQAFGPSLVSRVDFFEALTALPNGRQVYEALAGDMDHLADVLEMNPLQLGLELGKLSAAAGKPGKPKSPKVSEVPAPIAPIAPGGGKEFDPETASMEDYAADQERRRQERFAQRGF